MPTRVAALFNVPLLRRVAFHDRRIAGQVDRHVDDLRMQPGDDAVVAAESPGTLAPLPLQHE